MPKEHPKILQKVANMAPAWAQVGTMLGARDRPGTTDADPSIDPANHTQFSGFSAPGGRAAHQPTNVQTSIRTYIDTERECWGRGRVFAS